MAVPQFADSVAVLLSTRIVSETMKPEALSIVFIGTLNCAMMSIVADHVRSKDAAIEVGDRGVTAGGGTGTHATTSARANRPYLILHLPVTGQNDRIAVRCGFL